jgi:taurine dioxygenase
MSALVQRLLRQQGVLHIANSGLDDERLVSFAHELGVPDEVYPSGYRAPDTRYVRLQSNVQGLGVNDAGVYWHSDGPWRQGPCAVTLLLCVEAPLAGGETLFTDMRAARDRLTSGVRQQVDWLDGWFPCRAIYNERGGNDAATLSTLRDHTQPLVREHAFTGARALNLNEEWLRGVVGLSWEDAVHLLDHLYAVATSPTAIYRHYWSPGDLLIWDNASVMHKGLPTAAGRKITKRVMVAPSGISSVTEATAQAIG